MPKPKFIRKTKNGDAVFKIWLERVNRIEHLMGDGDDINRAFEIGYMLFPLLDSISFNLFNSDAHAYLRDMGLSRTEAALLIAVFRNGFIHNYDSYSLKYVDGKIGWGVLASAGTGGVSSFYPGYTDEENPEFNEPAETVIEYENFGNDTSMVTLYLDRLLALIRYDLEKRQIEYPKETIEFIVGQEMPGRKPKHD